MSSATVTRISASGGTIHCFVRAKFQIMTPRLGLLRPGDEVFLTEQEYGDPDVREAVITIEDIARQEEEEALQDAVSQGELRESLLEEEDEEGDAARGPGSIRGAKDRMIGGKKRGG